MAFDLYLDDDAMMVDFASVAPLGLLAHACRLIDPCAHHYVRCS